MKLGLFCAEWQTLKIPNMTPGAGRIGLMLIRGNSVPEAWHSDANLLEHGCGGGHREARPLGTEVARGAGPSWRSVSEASTRTHRPHRAG